MNIAVALIDSIIGIAIKVASVALFNNQIHFVALSQKILHNEQ